LLAFSSAAVCAVFFVCIPHGSVSSEQSAFDKREAAYRANNIGVALLEQYKPKDAAESFQRALTIDPMTRSKNFKACLLSTMKMQRPM
jgi:Tfp pilus assembly protein PilF